MIGICLDKYLGVEYELYLRPEYGYSLEQRQMMQRQYIVPDCIGFYLLSLYPMPFDKPMSQEDRDIHMGRIQWVVNQAIGRDVFESDYLQKVEKYMKRHKDMGVEQLLSGTKYSDFLWLWKKIAIFARSKRYDYGKEVFLVDGCHIGSHDESSEGRW